MFYQMECVCFRAISFLHYTCSSAQRYDKSILSSLCGAFLAFLTTHWLIKGATCQEGKEKVISLLWLVGWLVAHTIAPHIFSMHTRSINAGN